MKRLILMATTALFLFSCSKSDNGTTTEPDKTTGTTVAINNVDYPTVKIGTQTWTSVNYRGAGGINYNNTATIDEKQGKLYTLAEAKAILVPEGWRLPTLGDYQQLCTYLGGKSNNVGNIVDLADMILSDGNSKKLVSKEWTAAGGTNESGFNAYPSGTIEQNAFSGKGTSTTFWTSSLSGTYPYTITVARRENDNYNGQTFNYFGTTYSYITKLDRSCSIRFVKNN
jgi:uncharacterized protein (TIGR02145 family)